MHNFGKLVSRKLSIDVPGNAGWPVIGEDGEVVVDENNQPVLVGKTDATSIDVLAFYDSNDTEWHELFRSLPIFDFYVALTDDGRVVSFQSDPEHSQLAGLTILGISTEEANGLAIGAAYNMQWDGTKLVAPSISGSDVDVERDRRIAAGFVFQGITYQSRPEDRENIAGAATAALGAIIAGKLSGDLRWADPDKDFIWIAADNSEHPMDAQTTYALGQQAMAMKSACIFAGRALKDMSPIPTDYATNPSYWP